MSRTTRVLFLALAVFVLAAAAVAAAERFPRPQFWETDHEYPVNIHPPARTLALEHVDLGVFVLCLCAAGYAALKKRSRRMLVSLSIFAVIYFGFYRQGCVCPVGSVQNIALALFQPGYRIPITVLLFFALPLVSALVAGRIFCAGVCPLGAVQELMLFRPIRVPEWIDRPLRFLPWVYLVLALVMAGTGSAYIICQYDPFISVFRLSGSAAMIFITSSILLLGLFIGRPYCRYLCPYGALLELCSRLSHWHTTITPDECIKCKLCENSCPYNAIRTPVTGRMGPRRKRERAILAGVIIALPLLTAAGAHIGFRSHGVLSRTNLAVRTAEALVLAPGSVTDEQQDILDGFRLKEIPADELFAEAKRVKGQFATASGVGGGLLGIVLGALLISLTIRRRRKDYEPDRGLCVSCGRCYSYCPVGQAAETSGDRGSDAG